MANKTKQKQNLSDVLDALEQLESYCIQKQHGKTANDVQFSQKCNFIMEVHFGNCYMT